MADDIFTNLAIKYNIEDKKVFSWLIGKILSGEIKQEAIAYSINKTLNMDLNSAIVLANEIIFMNPEDKSTLKNKINMQEERNINYNQELNELIMEADLRLEDSLIERLKKLLSTYFLDIRKEGELRETLIRSSKIAGIGLSSEQADNLLNLARNKKKFWEENKIEFKLPAEEEVPFMAHEEEIDVSAKVKAINEPEEKTREIKIDELLQEKGIEFAELAKKERIKRQLGERERVPEVPDIAEEIIEEEKFLESKKEISAPRPEIETLPPPPPLPTEPVKKAEPIAPKIPVKPPIIRRADTDNRPKLEDIKVEVTAKLYGPIEELNALTIMDFRRLSKDPKEAALKIMGKLDLLEDESLIKKMQGIKALRSSPLYKTYAGIMNQAMMAGKSIEQVINESNTLTMPEYQAIMELNQNLKY